MSSPDTRTPPPESDTESTRMLNFDEARFVRIQSGAVERAAELAATVDKCLGDGAQNLFFLGSGGAGILMQPAAQLLLAQSGFPAFVHWPAELDRARLAPPGPAVHRGHPVAVRHDQREHRGAGLLQAGRGHGHHAHRARGHAAGPGRGPQRHQLRRGRHLQRVVLPAVAGDRPGRAARPRGDRGLRRRAGRSSADLPGLLVAVKEAAEDRAAARSRPPPRGRPLPHHHGRGLGLAAGLLLRHVHPGGDAVDPDPAGARGRLLPRHAGAGRTRCQRAAAQGRGRHPAARGPGRGVRVPLQRQARGDRHGQLRAARDLGPGPRPDLAGAAGHRARAGERAPGRDHRTTRSPPAATTGVSATEAGPRRSRRSATTPSTSTPASGAAVTSAATR